MRDINNYQERYNVPNFEDYQITYRRKKILEIMQNVKHDSILEIGTGMCPIFNYFDDFNKYYFFEPGKEFFDNAIQIAGNDNRIKGINKPFEFDENIKNQGLDFVICASLLHELENPKMLVQDICNISNENTHVLINVPNANSFHRVLAMNMGLIKEVKEFSDRNIYFQQHSVFDMNDIVQLVSECGFDVEDKGYLFIKPFTHSQMFEMIKNHIIDERVLDGLYKMTDMYPELGSEIWILCRKK